MREEWNRNFCSQGPPIETRASSSKVPRRLKPQKPKFASISQKFTHTDVIVWHNFKCFLIDTSQMGFHSVYHPSNQISLRNFSGFWRVPLPWSFPFIFVFCVWWLWGDNLSQIKETREHFSLFYSVIKQIYFPPSKNHHQTFSKTIRNGWLSLPFSFLYIKK